MKRTLNCTFLLLVLIAMGTMVASAQESLGAAARELKTEKKPATKKVYTNDDFVSDAPVMQATDKAPAATAEPNAAAAPAADADKAAKKEDKKDDKVQSDTAKLSEWKAWKQKVNEQQTQVAGVERELNLMEREHQVRVSVYYADAGTQLRDSKKWFEDEKKYQDDHTAKQGAVADAKKKLDDLKEAARTAGVPAGEIE